MKIKELVEELRALHPDTEMLSGITCRELLAMLAKHNPEAEVAVRSGTKVYTVEKKETLQ